MNGLRAVVAPVAQREVRQDVEDLDHVHAAGTRRRHRDDLEAAVAAAHRHALDDLVVPQVVRGDQAAVRARLGDDGRPDGAVVERLRAVAADQLQAAGQVGVAQDVARVGNTAIVEEDLARALPGAEVGVLRREGARQRLAHREALACQRDGRCHQRGALHRAVVIERVGEPGHGARHADGGLREQRLLGDDVAVGIEEHVAGGVCRRGLAEVDGGVLARLAIVQDHEAAAADVAGVGQRDRQREAHGDRGVHGVAAAPQHVHADVGGQRARRAHHAVQRVHRMDDGVVEVVVDEAGGLGAGLRAGGRGQRHGGGQGHGQAGQGGEAVKGQGRCHGRRFLVAAVKRWRRS